MIEYIKRNLRNWLAILALVIITTTLTANLLMRFADEGAAYWQFYFLALTAEALFLGLYYALPYVDGITEYVIISIGAFALMMVSNFTSFAELQFMFMDMQSATKTASISGGVATQTMGIEIAWLAGGLVGNGYQLFHYFGAYFSERMRETFANVQRGETRKKKKSDARKSTDEMIAGYEAAVELLAAEQLRFAAKRQTVPDSIKRQIAFQCMPNDEEMRNEFLALESVADLSAPENFTAPEGAPETANPTQAGKKAAPNFLAHPWQYLQSKGEALRNTFK